MRQFTPSEINHLIKFGFDPFVVAQTVDEHIPVEYITYRADFRGDIFNVDHNVLIPRIETEELINIALDIVDTKFFNKHSITFSDIGTGSGCIGISFAKELYFRKRFFRGYLLDVSKGALKLAYKNAKEVLPKSVIISRNNQDYTINGTTGKYNIMKIRESNLGLSEMATSDIIFANLPYIPSSRLAELQPSVRLYEPKLALDGGEDGLKYIRKLLKGAAKKAKRNAYLLLEVDDTHTEDVSREFKDIYKIVVKRDLNDRVRYWICKILK